VVDDPSADRAVCAGARGDPDRVRVRFTRCCRVDKIRADLGRPGPSTQTARQDGRDRFVGASQSSSGPVGTMRDGLRWPWVR